MLGSDECDPVTDFIDEECVVDSGGQVSARELWQKYCTWMEVSDYGLKPNRKKLTAHLERQGLRKTRQGNARTWTWVGIRIKEDGQSQQSHGGSNLKKDQISPDSLATPPIEVRT